MLWTKYNKENRLLFVCLFFPLSVLYFTPLCVRPQVQCVQEELGGFQGDCEEFESWLRDAEGEVQALGAPAGCLDTLKGKLDRQKSFSEDVISHKGDLRFITISGQKVLDVARACGRPELGETDSPLQVDTSGTCSAVKDKLDAAASRYKALHSQVHLNAHLMLLARHRSPN